MKEILLLLCQFPFNEGNKESLSKLVSGITDWNKLANLINTHGITALAAYNIREADLTKFIPPSFVAILENGLRQNIVRNIWLTEHWKAVDQILSETGIKHILLKGMALEYTVYGLKGLRQMSDNDILIKKEEAVRAWQMLQTSGFQAKTVKSALHSKILLETGKHLPALIKDDYAVEIHTRLFDNKIPGDRDYNQLFEEALEIKVGDRKAFILPTDIHLEYLKNHFGWHVCAGECQLRSYADLILLDKESAPEFPDQFILNPFQSDNRAFRKAAYRSNVFSVPAKYRFRFILGDIFPSVKWMKERYKCMGMKVYMYYPARIAKLLWLM